MSGTRSFCRIMEYHWDDFVSNTVNSKSQLSVCIKLNLISPLIVYVFMLEQSKPLKGHKLLCLQAVTSELIPFFRW